MRRWLAIWTRLVVVTLIVGAVALASLDTGTGAGQAVSLAPQTVTAPTLSLSTPTTARVTTTSASPVTVPLTFGFTTGYFAAERNLTATVTVSGASPGTVHLDDTGLTLTGTTTSASTVLSFSGTTTSVAAALTEGRLTWLVPEQPGQVTVSATVRQDLPASTTFNPANGHYYQTVSTTRSWDGARADAATRGLFGLTGYLVTITSEAEQQFVSALVSSNDWWIGATDTRLEGVWEWVEGPEGEANGGTGTVFWTSASQPRAQRGIVTVSGVPRFAWWDDESCLFCGDEPNNFLTGEDRGALRGTNGRWKDEDQVESRRALVEFGLADGDTTDRAVVTFQTTLTAVSRLVDIVAYADANNGTPPNAAEWAQAMITGVDTEAFATSLATVLASANVSGANVDSTTGAQALVDSYRRILDYATTNGTATAPTAADYERLGLGTLASDVLTRMNGRVASAGVTGTDTYAKLAAHVTEALVTPQPSTTTTTTTPPSTTPPSTTTTTTTTTPLPPPPPTTTTTATTTTTPTTTTTTTPTTTVPPTSPVAPNTVPTTTTAPPSPTLAPVVEFPNGQPVIIAPGSAVLLVDGQELGLQVTPRGDDALSITGQGVALTMTATTSDGAPRPLADDGTLVVAHRDRLAVSGDGFGPQQPVEMWAFSTPLALGSTTTDIAGALSVAVTIPEALAPGTHTLQLVGLDSESALRAVSLGLTVTEAQEQPTDTSVPTTEPPVTQPPAPDPNPAEPEPAPDEPASPQPGDPYSALDNPEDLVENAVTAVAVLAAASAAGAAAGAAGAAARSSTPGASGGGSSNAASDEVGYVEAVGSMHLEANVEDRTASRWQWIANWPATRRLDQLTRSVLQWSAPKSPLLERVVGDGSTWRALFGSASLLLTATGAVLGVLASIDIGGEATPPALALMTALMIVGTMDALAGSVGFLVIAGSVIASGGVENAWDVRTLLGLAAAFVGPGLVAKAFRPLRRPPSTTLADWWERLADLAIAPLMGGLVAQGMVWGLNGMAGVYLPITDYTNRLALWVMAALAVQVVAEEMAARWFPSRIVAVTPEDYPDPSALRQAVSVVISAATYVFVVIAFLGNTWQLWAAVALYAGPMLLGLVADRFPNSPVLWRLLPQGTPYMVVLLWMGVTLAVWVEQWLGATPDYARTSFVVLAGFPALLALLALVGREPADGEVRWNERPALRHAYRLGGVVTLWVGIQTMV